jgi:uncharacterized protein involved in exopolysaccharide biosynthesis
MKNESRQNHDGMVSSKPVRAASQKVTPPMNGFGANSYQSGARNGSGVRVQLSAADLTRMLLRELWLMAAIFSIISLIGISFAMTLQREYKASARLSILLGEEYVFSPRVGAAGEGAVPKQEQIVQSEVEVLTSQQVAERTVRAVGLDRLFQPEDIVVSQGSDTPDRRLAFGVDAFRKKFGASATPNTTVIQLVYANRDPVVAADTLNKLIDEYLLYRREVLFEDRSSELGAQRTDFENQLATVEQELSAFLAANGVADFPSERATLQTLLASTRAELLNVESRRSEAEGRLSVTARNLQREPAERRAEFASDNSQRRLELQSQLADLRTRYTDESQPVQDLLRRIEALDQLLSSPEGRAAGQTKTGPNPIRDSLATDTARADADVAALIGREQVLVAQVAQIQARSVQLAARQPQYEDLLRRKAVLEEQVRQFSNREASARAQNALNANSNENIRVIERASPPPRGQSNKRWAVLGAIALAGFTALMAGLVRVLSRSNFPTAGSVGRTLGLPVLATVNVARGY